MKNNKTTTITPTTAIAAFSLVLLFLYGVRGVGVGNVLSVEIPREPKILTNISIEAKSAYVFDIKTGQAIFALNSDDQLPLASLTKIMTAITAKENLPSALEIGIPLKAILQEGDSGFVDGERWIVSDLEDVMLISSSNDAAFALAMSFAGGDERAFVALMNKKASELNLRQTYFLNPTGLDVSASLAGAYGSAKDVAEMIIYGFKKYQGLFRVTSFGEIKIARREFKNTNKLVNELPGLLAGKTGFSDLAGGNLVVIVDIGAENPVVISVLGSSPQGRFDDVKTLYNASVKYFQNKR